MQGFKDVPLQRQPSALVLNAVEGFFAKLQAPAQSGLFRSIVENLQAAINRFLRETKMTIHVPFASRMAHKMRWKM